MTDEVEEAVRKPPQRGHGTSVDPKGLKAEFGIAD